MSNDSFKVPSLPTLPSKVEAPPPDPPPDPPSNSPKPPSELLKEPDHQYTEPSWGNELPPNESNYCLEELKNGTIAKEHKLLCKSYFVIGRFRTCDIKLRII